MTSITPSALLDLVLIGFAVGAVGQTARVIIGIKKTSQEAVATNQRFSALFDGTELLVSVAIGGTAGVLASLAIIDTASVTEVIKISKEQIFAIAAAGYAGADFIEGAVRNPTFQSNQPLPPQFPPNPPPQGSNQTQGSSVPPFKPDNYSSDVPPPK